MQHNACDGFVGSQVWLPQAMPASAVAMPESPASAAEPLLVLPAPDPLLVVWVLPAVALLDVALLPFPVPAFVLPALLPDDCPLLHPQRATTTPSPPTVTKIASSPLLSLGEPSDTAHLARATRSWCIAARPADFGIFAHELRRLVDGILRCVDAAQGERIIGKTPRPLNRVTAARAPARCRPSPPVGRRTRAPTPAVRPPSLES